MTKIKHATDHQLRYEIEHEREWTADVNSDHVGISVNDGAGPLSGEVVLAAARENVTAALLRNAELEAAHVEVKVQGTEIRLTGKVSTWGERHEAEFAAWCTPGVTHVDDRIEVVS